MDKSVNGKRDAVIAYIRKYVYVHSAHRIPKDRFSFARSEARAHRIDFVGIALITRKRNGILGVRLFELYDRSGDKRYRRSADVKA